MEPIILSIIYFGGALYFVRRGLFKRDILLWERILCSVIAVFIALHGVMRFYAHLQWTYHLTDLIAMNVALGMLLSWVIYNIWGKPRKHTVKNLV